MLSLIVKIKAFFVNLYIKIKSFIFGVKLTVKADEAIVKAEIEKVINTFKTKE